MQDTKRRLEETKKSADEYVQVRAALEKEKQALEKEKQALEADKKALSDKLRLAELKSKQTSSSSGNALVCAMYGSMSKSVFLVRI